MEVDELYDMGQRSLNLGNPKEALKYFTKALSLNPHHQKSLVKKGNVLGKLGKYGQAITFYDYALKLDQNDLLALLNKGLALHFLKRYQNAIDCYDTILKFKPDNLTTLYNKSSSLIQLGNVDEGLSILSQIVSEDPSFKEQAKYDVDFHQIRHLNEFKEILLS